MTKERYNEIKEIFIEAALNYNPSSGDGSQQAINSLSDAERDEYNEMSNAEWGRKMFKDQE